MRSFFEFPYSLRVFSMRLNPCFSQFSRTLTAFVVCFYCFNTNAVAQVHYYENGSPWNRKANSGPDSMVPGWFYNLGITGLRVELTSEQILSPLQQRLAKFKCPKRVFFVDALPRNTMGKVQKNEMRKTYENTFKA